MQPLRHSYTNDTRGDGRVVVKRYRGPDAGTRWARERLALRWLRGRLPVPELLDGDGDGALRMRFVAGVPGQERRPLTDHVRTTRPRKNISLTINGSRRSNAN